MGESRALFLSVPINGNDCFKIRKKVDQALISHIVNLQLLTEVSTRGRIPVLEVTV